MSSPKELRVIGGHMKQKLVTVTILIVGVFAVPVRPAVASTWYVNGVHGSDSQQCKSTTTACKTIGHAISLASAGDSIMVAPATYYENLTLGVSLNVIGSGAATTIIDGRCFNTVITIPNTSARVALSNVTVQNGCARYAGGISNRGTLWIIASTISGNRAAITNKYGSTGGGGIYNYGTMTITDSTLSGNMAKAFCYESCGAYGGGIANAIPAMLTINNSTLTGNVASRGCYRYCSAEGGGIEAGGTLIISNSTLSGNAAPPASGGGIGGPATLQNSIVAHSPGGNCAGQITSYGHNLSSDGTCNFNAHGDLNNHDPLLGPLQNNGGPTPTMALLPGSPAIDAGNPGGCTDGQGHLLTTDQRGMPRPNREDLPAKGCDIGAYERQSD